jgi:hypothetical protein
VGLEDGARVGEDVGMLVGDDGMVDGIDVGL